MNRWYLLIMRAFLGAFFAVLLTRIFYPQAHPVFGVGLGVFLVGVVYLIEHFKNRRPG